MNKEEIKQEPNDGLIARILGGTPTILKKVFFILMAFILRLNFSMIVRWNYTHKLIPYTDIPIVCKMIPYISRT